MKHFYRILALGLMVTLLAVLGCSSDDEDGAATQPAAPAAAGAAAAAAAAQAAPAAPAAPAAAARAAPAPTAAPAAFPKVATPVTRAAPVVMEKMPKQGGTLVYIPSATIANLDPIRNTGFVTREVTNQFYDIPFGWTMGRSSEAQMVSDWSLSDDAISYSFTLRDNLAFHDGTPVTAADVTASINRWRTGVSVSVLWELGGEPDLVVVDDKNFNLEMGKPFALWVNYWGLFGTWVMPKAAADALAFEDVNTDYNASGPYKFEDWVPGATITLLRNDGYVPREEPKDGSAGGRIPYLDKIRYIEIPDAATRVAALQTGQGDFSVSLPTDFYDLLNDDPKIKVQVLLPFSRQMIAMNKTVRPLNNPKARLAVQAITDPEKYMTAAYGNPDLYQLCPALFGCGSQWDTDAGADLYWEVDVEKGKRLWAEAMAEENYSGKMILLTTPDIPSLYNRALLLKEDLETLGAEVEFAVSDWATLLSRKIANLNVDPQDDPSKGWHFYPTGNENYNDPINDATFGSGWNGGWGSQKGYDLVEAFANSKSFDEAYGIIEEIQRHYYEEDPSLIVHGFAPFLTAQQLYVMDFVPHQVVFIDGMWLDR